VTDKAKQRWELFGRVMGPPGNQEVVTDLANNFGPTLPAGSRVEVCPVSELEGLRNEIEIDEAVKRGKLEALWSDRLHQAEQQAASMREELSLLRGRIEGAIEAAELTGARQEVELLRRVEGFFSQPPTALEESGAAEPVERIAAVIDRCRRLEEDARPRAREGLPNDIARAQGEVEVAKHIRELLEQELPAPLQPQEQPAGGDAHAAQDGSGLVAEPGVDVPGARPEVSETDMPDENGVTVIDRAVVADLQDGQAVSVVIDFLASWRYCPVSQASAPARSCLEDAAKQLLAALPAQSASALSDEDREHLLRLANIIGGVHRPFADPELHEDDARFLRNLADRQPQDKGLTEEAIEALEEVADRPTKERNPDGHDQAAESMALLAAEHAKRFRFLLQQGGGR